MRRAETPAVVSYALSCVLAAVAVGALLGVIGGALGVPAAFVAAIALVSLALASRIVPFRLPSSPWRVPKHWGGPSAWRNGASFGAPLGAGFLTALPSAGLYSVAAACLVLPVPAAAAVYGAFGVARSAPVVIAWASPYGDESDVLPLQQVARAGALSRLEVVLIAVLVPAAVLAA